MPSRDVLVLRHTPWEGPGLVAKSAQNRGFRLLEFFASDLDASDNLSSVAHKARRRVSDGGGHAEGAPEGGHPERASSASGNLPASLVIMGGPMAVYEKDEYPWIHTELNLIIEALEAEVGVLGVCLGAQMMAEAMGARIYKGEVGAEIGFGCVRLTEQALDHPVLGRAARAVAGGSRNDTAEHRATSESSMELTSRGWGATSNHRVPSRSIEVPVFHWHGDTFDIPSGCTRLAESSMYPNQSFGAGEKVLALQFHLEVDEDLYQMWAPHLPEPSTESPPTRGHPGSFDDPPRLPRSKREIDACIAEVSGVGSELFEAYFQSL